MWEINIHLSGKPFIPNFAHSPNSSPTALWELLYLHEFWVGSPSWTPEAATRDLHGFRVGMLTLHTPFSLPVNLEEWKQSWEHVKQAVLPQSFHFLARTFLILSSETGIRESKMDIMEQRYKCSFLQDTAFTALKMEKGKTLDRILEIQIILLPVSLNLWEPWIKFL